MRPATLKPASILFATRPHGTRHRYMAGCKCLLCRAANSRYECSRAAARRAGAHNGLVAADRARTHLRKLSALGVGRRAVSDACDVSETILQLIKTGRRSQIRRSTEQRILSVDREAAAGGALVPAGRTWRLINQLLQEGYTKRFLARRLGRKNPALQLKTKVITKRNAVLIERLYTRLIT